MPGELAQKISRFLLIHNSYYKMHQFKLHSSQGCVAISTNQFQNIFITPKETPYALEVIPHSLLSLAPGNANLLSISMDFGTSFKYLNYLKVFENVLTRNLANIFIKTSYSLILWQGPQRMGQKQINTPQTPKLCNDVPRHSPSPLPTPHLIRLSITAVHSWWGDGREKGWQGHLLEGEERGEINNNKMLKCKYKSDKELRQVKTLTLLGMTMVRANTEYSLCARLKTCNEYLFPSSSWQPSNTGSINSPILNISNWGDSGVRTQGAGLRGP